MSSKLSAYCALVNDQGDAVLRDIIDHLGLLESGGLEARQQKIGAETVPLHTIHLDTKYYTCDVPLLSCHAFDRFKAICAAERSGSLEILAALFCATRQQLTDNFLALLSKYSNSLEKAEVKALILRDDDNDGGDETAASDGPSTTAANDELVNKFALSRGIEIIKIGRNKTHLPEHDDDEEEGLNGIPRLVEAIETVQWPNMKTKPNPVGQRAHRMRLQEYINSSNGDVNNSSNNDDDANNSAAFADLLGSHFMSSFTSNKICNDVGHHSMKKLVVDNVPAGSDYPDSEDEEAIMEWFDKPKISEDILQLSNIPWKSMNELRLGNSQMSLKERVDVTEGITYDFLKTISASNKPSDNSKKE